MTWNPNPEFVPLTGGCNCGKVRFRLEIPPIITHCCHCRRCQKTSGSAFCVNAMIETEKLTLLCGTAEAFHGDSSHPLRRCADCGLTLWSHIPQLGEAIAIVGVGVLDCAEQLAPEAHYFIRSKHPWVTLPPNLPAFDQLGDPGKAGVRARIEAALAGAR